MGLLARILGVDQVESGRAPTRRGTPEEGIPPRVPERDDGAALPGFAARVEAVLEDVRPALRADGGDIHLVEVLGRSAKVRLVGACDGCPSAALTLRFGIEKRLKEAIPEFEELIAVL